MQIISRLAHSYRTIPFPPHITLLANINANLSTIKQACKKVVEQTQEFDIPLQKIGYTEAYYRNFYVQAELTQAVSKVYEGVKFELAYKSTEDFMPHLSLLYGNLDLKTKHKLTEQLEGIYPKIINCKRLDLYETNGKINDWSLVEAYYFCKN